MSFVKRILPFVLLGFAAVIGVVVWLSARSSGQDAYLRFLTDETPFAEYVDTTEEPIAAEKTVVTSEPLQGNLAPSEGRLTVAGTVTETNAQRAALGLTPLSFNAQLTAAAQAKVTDMISRQYFEHESPDGIGPGELADAAGYDYLAVAENLALGNYENDADLVGAWMDSPGHRENIVSTTYSDIGVAVGQGMFEGDVVWFAVQEFGRPASDCPLPPVALQKSIDFSQRTLEEAKDLLDEALEEIENTEPKRGASYNAKVDAYNDLVKSYNTLIAETETLIETYNSEVREYNECAR